MKDERNVDMREVGKGIGGNEVERKMKYERMEC